MSTHHVILLTFLNKYLVTIAVGDLVIDLVRHVRTASLHRHFLADLHQVNI